MPITVPPELRDFPQWVCWRYEERDGKRTKAPINPKSDGRPAHAKTNDPTTWADFDTALAFLQANPALAGVGFCFSPQDGLTGIDLDHVIDPTTGEVKPEALEILERFQGTYAEISPSGTGLRIFCQGKPRRSGKNAGKAKWLEIYSDPSHRYLTVTGNRWPGNAETVTDQQPVLDWLHETHMNPKPRKTSSADLTAPFFAGSPEPDDAKLLSAARAAANGAKFAALWSGDTSGHNGDHSAADQALCNLLAFWTGNDAARMDRLFRQSGLMRPKWDTKRGESGTYGSITLAEAIAATRETYRTPSRANSRPYSKPPERPEDPEQPPYLIDSKEYKNSEKAKRKNQPAETAAGDDSGDSRPVVRLVQGERTRTWKESEDVLIGLGGVYHNRAGILVRVTRTGQRSECGVDYANNSLTILPATPGWITTELDRGAVWKKQRVIDGNPVEFTTDAPLWAARFLSEQVGGWRLPFLSGIVEAPTLRRDGSVLEREGYDPATGLYFDAGGTAFDPIPQNPTRAEAASALEAIIDAVKDFPYAADQDRSVFVSGVLTVLVRHMLRDAPLHCSSSPRPRTGKSYQADLAALIATGRPAPAMSATDSPDEEEKRIVSILLSGTPLALIDNIDEPLKSPRLCSAITQETFRGRLLGGNRLADLSTRLVWFASGNNLRLHDDLNPRALLCYLIPETDRPEEREFDRDLKAWTLEQRHRLAPAAITALRAYIVAGMPSQNLKGFGSAPDWSALVRSALVWLGRADPAASQERLRQNDPVGSRLSRLMESWFEAFGPMWITAADAERGSAKHPNLADALKEASEDDVKVNTRKLGNYLMMHNNRIEGRYRLTAGDTRQKIRRYRVEKIHGPEENPQNPQNPQNHGDHHQQPFSDQSFYNPQNPQNPLD